MRRVILLCALAGCSVDHTGLGPGATARDASADEDSTLFDSGSSEDSSVATVDAATDVVALDARVVPADVGMDSGDMPVDAGPDGGPDAATDSGPSCSDNVLNGDESDIDCGGDCGRCTTGASCRVGSDCGSLRCDTDDAQCRTPESCLDLLSGDATLETGVYTIDPDGPGPGPSFAAWCDMAFDDGGWTLVVASNATGPRDIAEGEAMPRTTLHLSRASVEPLVLAASQVHIRTEGMAEERSITSTPNSTPIVNLRAFNMLETERGGSSDSWMGPMLDHVSYSCQPGTETYPHLFHACGNRAGLHWSRGNSTWEYDEPNEALEMYVR